MFRVNVLVLLICLAAFVLHELAAHHDVDYATPRRNISIWKCTCTTTWPPSRCTC